MKYGFLLLVGMILLLPTGASANQEFSFTVTDVTASTGATFDLSVLFDNVKDCVEGWSIGVCHDAAQLTVNQVGNGADLQAVNDGDGPDLAFYEIDSDPSGWASGIVLSVVGGEDLGPGLSYEIHVANYAAVGQDVNTEVCPCDEMVGDPPTAVSVVVGGLGFDVETFCGLITIGMPVETFQYIVKDQEFEYNQNNGEGSLEIQPQIAENPHNLQFPNDTTAFTMGVAHDGKLLTALSVAPFGELALLNEGAGPDLFIPEVFPDAGIAVTAVYGTSPPMESIQFDVPKPILSIAYDTKSELLAGQERSTNTLIQFTDELGVGNGVLAGVGFEVIPMDGRLTLLPVQPDFVRGDCNVSGTVDIADSVFILNQLFGSPPPSRVCDDACDTNGDHMKNIADAVYLLNFLFVMGTPPPPPWPDCGRNEDPLAIGCEVFPSCR
ncbi:MAG: hypothetical protein V3T77_07870 [Planctomycetota bacterium]